MRRSTKYLLPGLAAAVLAGATMLLVAGRGSGPTAASESLGPFPAGLPGGEKSDERNLRVFDTDHPFGAGVVAALRFGWPVKPFDQPHVLRATFGEPRGLLDAGVNATGRTRAQRLTQANQLLPIGRRVIHSGVDIVAPDGTPVYAVESGVAQAGGSGYDQYVLIGRFGYWHLANLVPTGTQVTAFVTVIGTVYPGQQHVHLTRFATPGHPVNPLLGGGLQPYADTAAPIIDRLAAFDPRGRSVPLAALRGPVVLAVHSSDIQSDGSTRTGLYSLRYSVEPVGGGTSAVSSTETFRFDVLPSQAAGDAAYTLGSTRHKFETRFWYRLTDRSPSADGFLHTERLAPGDYRLVAVAADARGNQARRGFPITVVAR